MALNLPTFFTRLGSAIVFSALMMAGLLWNKWAFALLMLMIMLLSLREFFKLITKIYSIPEGNKWMDTGILIVSVAFFSALFTFLFYPEKTMWMRLFLVISVLLITLGFLKSLLQKNNPFKVLALKGSSLFYILMPVLLMLCLRYISLCIPLALILMIWMNDTMAYLTGSFIGRTPFSKISPKKTWEGTVGGAVFTLVGAAVWGYYSPYYQMIDWMALALCASVAGTAGDLFESKLKRMAGVKDSGAMMPGHGGALDRFDSLLVATPFAYAYVYLFMPAQPVTIF